MEAINTASMAEALRWLSTAEKLLGKRDLTGSKTFATRARDSDPKLEHAERILSVVDTLTAGEERINNQHDWYAVLQLPRLEVDSELIATQYRRLALLLNPQKNKFPFSDQAFRLIVDAWSVLSNPKKKSIYDSELDLYYKINSNRFGQQSPESEQSQPHNRNINDDRRKNSESSAGESTDRRISSFWTACPYCYHVYEYPRVYMECTLRCQNCRRAFHAVVVPPPPPSLLDGTQSRFSCWGFFPMGAKLKENNNDGNSNWTPFVPLFTSPPAKEEVSSESNLKNRSSRKANLRKNSTPQVFVDEEHDFVAISDSSDDSDTEWGVTRKKKKKAKTPISIRKNLGKLPEKSKNIKYGAREFILQQRVRAESNSFPAEPSKKPVENTQTSGRKQTGEMGTLDLNVEFNNDVEVEESAPTIGRTSEGNGEEDNIEGIGFFEGLDEFLNSLPILNTTGDGKVKAG